MARQSLFSKAKNALLIALAFSDAITWLLQGEWGQVVYEYSAGLVANPQRGGRGGTFDQNAALRAYGPFVAAFAVGYAANELQKRFPVRG